MNDMPGVLFVLGQHCAACTMVLQHLPCMSDSFWGLVECGSGRFLSLIQPVYTWQWPGYRYSLSYTLLRATRHVTSCVAEHKH